MSRKDKFFKLTSGVVLLGSAPSLVSMAEGNEKSIFWEALKYILCAAGVITIVPYILLLNARSKKLKEIETNLKLDGDEMEILRKKIDTVNFVESFFVNNMEKIEKIGRYSAITYYLVLFHDKMEKIRKTMKEFSEKFSKFGINMDAEAYKDKDKFIKTVEDYKNKHLAFMLGVESIFKGCGKVIKKMTESLVGREKLDANFFKDSGSLDFLNFLKNWLDKKTSFINSSCNNKKIGGIIQRLKDKVSSYLETLDKEPVKFGRKRFSNFMYEVKEKIEIVAKEYSINVEDFKEHSGVVGSMCEKVLSGYEDAMCYSNKAELESKNLGVDERESIFEKIQNDVKSGNTDFMKKQVEFLKSCLGGFVKEFESKLKGCGYWQPDRFFYYEFGGNSYGGCIKEFLKFLNEFLYINYWSLSDYCFSFVRYYKGFEKKFLKEKLDCLMKKCEVMEPLTKKKDNLYNNFYSIDFFKSFD